MVITGTYQDMQWLQRHPPSDAELAAAMQGGAVASLGASEHQVHQQVSGRKRRSTVGAAHFPEEEVRRHRAAWARAQQTPAVAAITATRNALPIAPYRCLSSFNKIESFSAGVWEPGSENQHSFVTRV